MFICLFFCLEKKFEDLWKVVTGWMRKVPAARVHGRSPVTIGLAVNLLAMVIGPEGAIKKLEMNRLQQSVVGCACLVNTAGGWMVTKVAYDQYLQSDDMTLANGIVQKVDNAQKKKGSGDYADCAYSQPQSILSALIAGHHSPSLHNEVQYKVEEQIEELIRVLKSLMAELPVFVLNDCIFPELRALPWSRVAYSTQRVRTMVEEELGHGFLDVRRDGVEGYQCPWLRERKDFERWSCNGGEQTGLWNVKVKKHDTNV